MNKNIQGYIEKVEQNMHALRYMYAYKRIGCK